MSWRIEKQTSFLQNHQYTFDPKLLSILGSNIAWCINDDKQFAIPLNTKSFLGFKKLLQPTLMQQYKTHPFLNEDDVKELLVFLRSKYRKGQIQMDQKSTEIHSVQCKTRSNYVLKLDIPQEEQWKKLNSNTKRAINENIQKHEFGTIKDDKLFYKFFLQNRNQTIKVIPSELDKIELLLKYCIGQNLGFIDCVSLEGQMTAGCFFIQWNECIYYLLPVSSELGKQNESMRCLLWNRIRNKTSKQLTLDFEGSDLPGVAQFIRGFGAELHPYYEYSWSIL